MKQNEDTFLLKNAITCHDMLKHWEIFFMIESTIDLKIASLL